MSPPKKKAVGKTVKRRTKTGSRTRVEGPSGKKQPAWVEPFLKLIKDNSTAQDAAEAVGISRQAVYKYKSRNPEFSKRYVEATEIVIDNLEQSALDKAFNGWEEPVFYQGVQCGTKRVFSPTLMIFFLKTRRPVPYNIETGATTTGNSSPHEAAVAIRDAVKAMDGSIGTGQ